MDFTPGYYPSAPTVLFPAGSAGRAWGIAALESSVGAMEHSRGCNPRNGCKSPVNIPQPNRTAERWPVTSPCDVSTCCGILSSGAIIIGFYHRGGLCVVCSSCHRSAVPMGMVCAHRGFHPFRGFHPRLWSFAPTALFHAVFCRQDMGRRDVACNVSLPIMVFLPLDHVMLGMET